MLSFLCSEATKFDVQLSTCPQVFGQTQSFLLKFRHPAAHLCQQSGNSPGWGVGDEHKSASCLFMAECYSCVSQVLGEGRDMCLINTQTVRRLRILIRVQSWNCPLQNLTKAIWGPQEAVYTGRSFLQVLGASFIEVNHQETMYLSHIISAPSRNAITQVRFNTVPSAHGRKNSHLLRRRVEDIHMKKSLSSSTQSWRHYSVSLIKWLP